MIIILITDLHSFIYLYSQEKCEANDMRPSTTTKNDDDKIIIMTFWPFRFFLSIRFFLSFYFYYWIECFWRPLSKKSSNVYVRVRVRFRSMTFRDWSVISKRKNQFAIVVALFKNWWCFFLVSIVGRLIYQTRLTVCLCVCVCFFYLFS